MNPCCLSTGDLCWQKGGEGWPGREDKGTATNSKTVNFGKIEAIMAYIRSWFRYPFYTTKFGQSYKQNKVTKQVSPHHGVIYES